MLEVKGVTKSYGKLIAVTGVSFRADYGETIGLLGPNGAGKTTNLQRLPRSSFLDSRRFDAKPGILNAECGQVCEFVRRVSGAPPLRVLNLAPICILFPVREA